MPSKMITAGTVARDLGARGSRAAVAGSDPAASLPESVLAVLAAVPAWWAARAAAATFSGSWLDVGHALLPLPSAKVLREWNSLTGNSLEVAVASAYQPEST